MLSIVAWRRSNNEYGDLMHFRLRKADDLDGRESWECDQPTVDMALLYFGHQLKVVLALKGDVLGYVIESRMDDVPNFKDSEKLPVYVLK
jgi:hypothetical protein